MPSYGAVGFAIAPFVARLIPRKARGNGMVTGLMSCAALAGFGVLKKCRQ